MTAPDAITQPTNLPNEFPAEPLPDLPSSHPRPLGWVEIPLIAIGLALLMAGQSAISKPKLIYDGPFILDECLTDSIVRDPGIAHSIQAVRHGVDTNPPTYHLIVRGFWMGFHQVFHDASSRIALRAFSMICTWLALVGVYILLRKSFSRCVALVAALAVWAHPIVIEQSANGRFYAPLLLATIAMCLSLQIRGTGIMRGIIVALCAMLLCTLHYFGILILGPIVLAMLLIDEAAVWPRIIQVLPALAGPLALLPFVPFIRTQHEGISVRTWVDPFSFHLARVFSQEVLCPLALLFAVGIWSIGQLMRRKSQPATAESRTLRIATLPMLSLILVPLIIVAFSAVVQSALIPRYAIAGALALAPLVALLAEDQSRPLLLILAIVSSGYTVMELHSVGASRAGDLRTLTHERDELQNEQPPLPIVFANRADATQLQNFAPDLFPRISIVDQRAPGVQLLDFRAYEIEMVSKVGVFYPTPPLITPAQMGAMGRFHLVAAAGDIQTLMTELPMHHVSGDVYEAVK